MPARRKSTPAKDSTANLGFEAKLWLAADKLRNNMDAAEYKHVVLATIDLVASNQPSPQPSPSGRGSEDSELLSTSGRGAGGEGCLRDLRRETLFIDARKMGTLIDRVHRELTDGDLEKITSTYHAWRGDGLLGTKPRTNGLGLVHHLNRLGRRTFRFNEKWYVEEVTNLSAPDSN